MTRVLKSAGLLKRFKFEFGASPFLPAFTSLSNLTPQYWHFCSSSSDSGVKQVSLSDLLDGESESHPNIKISKAPQRKSRPTRQMSSANNAKQNNQHATGRNSFARNARHDSNNNNVNSSRRFVRRRDDSEQKDVVVQSKIESKSVLRNIDKEDVLVKYSEFDKFGLRPKLAKALKKHNMAPLPIQALSYPYINEAREKNEISGSIIQSPMGTGKTLAYLLPALNALNTNKMNQIIIVVPSNELAEQIKATIKAYIPSEPRVNEVICVCKNNDPFDYLVDYISKLKSSIIVGTPKILRTLFLEKVLQPHRVEFLIFDETDTLFPIQGKHYSKAKHKQKREAFKRHIKPSQVLLAGVIKQHSVDPSDSNETSKQKHTLPERKLSVLFAGATMPSMLQHHVSTLMTPNPVQLLEVEAPNTGTNQNSSGFLNFSDASDTVINFGRDHGKYISPNITHQFVGVDCNNSHDESGRQVHRAYREKARIVAEIVNYLRRQDRRRPGCFVFLRNDGQVVRFAEELARLEVNVALIHEHLDSKENRFKFLSMLRNGKIECAIGTEQVARGLDAIWMDHVIVAEVPKQAANYLHLAGRTGRLYSKGFVTTVADDNDAQLLDRHCMRLGIELNRIERNALGNVLRGQKQKVDMKYIEQAFPLLLEGGYSTRKEQLQLPPPDKEE